MLFRSNLTFCLCTHEKERDRANDKNMCVCLCEPRGHNVCFGRQECVDMVSIVTSNHPHHGCDESVAGGGRLPTVPLSHISPREREREKEAWGGQGSQ